MDFIDYENIFLKEKYEFCVNKPKTNKTQIFISGSDNLWAFLAVELESALLCTHAERVSFFISPIIPKLYPFVSARNTKEGHCWSSFLPMASYSSSSNFNKLNSGLKEGRDETSQCHWKGAHLSLGEADA